MHICNLSSHRGYVFQTADGVTIAGSPISVEVGDRKSTLRATTQLEVYRHSDPKGQYSASLFTLNTLTRLSSYSEVSGCR